MSTNRRPLMQQIEFAQSTAIVSRYHHTMHRNYLESRSLQQISQKVQRKRTTQIHYPHSDWSRQICRIGSVMSITHCLSITKQQLRLLPPEGRPANLYPIIKKKSASAQTFTEESSSRPHNRLKIGILDKHYTISNSIFYRRHCDPSI
jgi:hypothetical protein